MLGGISDISQLCEHGLYDWVMFRYEPIQCPNEDPVLGRYLGSAIERCITLPFAFMILSVISRPTSIADPKYLPNTGS